MPTLLVFLGCGAERTKNLFVVIYLARPKLVSFAASFHVTKAEIINFNISCHSRKYQNQQIRTLFLWWINIYRWQRRGFLSNCFLCSQIGLFQWKYWVGRHKLSFVWFFLQLSLQFQIFICNFYWQKRVKEWNTCNLRYLYQSIDEIYLQIANKFERSTDMNMTNIFKINFERKTCGYLFLW